MIDVIATLGPACQEVETLVAMIQAGMTTARLNLSHGDYALHRELATALRRACQVAGQEVALLADLQGAKVRIGWLGQPVSVQPGDKVVLVGDGRYVGRDRAAQAVPVLPVDFDLGPHVAPGQSVLIDDGQIELRVEAVVEGRVRCRVVHGGVIRERKGVNVPYTPLPIPALTEKDRADAVFAVHLGVDWIALSFAGSARDVEELRQLIQGVAGPDGSLPRIMAKIERPDGVENLVEIIRASDGVMVARGDLALETNPWQLPLLQKQIVRACREHGKKVVVATQMLESMVHRARPTRAEVSDVANALLDGADGVMLSGETALGAHPVAAVQTMCAIVRHVVAAQESPAWTPPPPALGRQAFAW